jgi:hypothetical protein
MKDETQRRAAEHDARPESTGEISDGKSKLAALRGIDAKKRC